MLARPRHNFFPAYESVFGFEFYNEAAKNKRAKQIRLDYHNGMSLEELCEKYDRSEDAICRTLKGRTFKDAGGPIIKKLNVGVNLNKAQRDEIGRRLVFENEWPSTISKEYGISKDWAREIKQRYKRRLQKTGGL